MNIIYSLFSIHTHGNCNAGKKISLKSTPQENGQVRNRTDEKN